MEYTAKIANMLWRPFGMQKLPKAYLEGAQCISLGLHSIAPLAFLLRKAAWGYTAVYSLCRLFAHKQVLAATANALLLQKCLKQRMWDNSSMECMQLQGVGKQTSKLLAAAKLGKLRQLAAADPRKIEAVTQRHYPFGRSHEPLLHFEGWLYCAEIRKTSATAQCKCSCDGADPLVLLAGNTLKQHLQSVMPPQLNLTILAKGAYSVFGNLTAVRRE